MMRSTYIITVHQSHHPAGRGSCDDGWISDVAKYLAIFPTWQAFHM